MNICSSELIILTILLGTAISSGQKWSNYNSLAKSRSSPYVDDNDGDRASETPASQQSKSVSRGGIGGWGIIAITLTIIFSGIGIYYFVLFYPILCKKEGKYDVMEMTTV